ncbi:MBL fold metallo-hydrolase [Kordiimonas aquimaris]|uniref:MBL fold metallo-hydrolase n=1 Tax=Kordiimonas aquimaris TaxID=707591 RepID=UPI0021D22012|nr:MBL fold metallo-hydrolase [Kordiimonas aquimaris]
MNKTSQSAQSAQKSSPIMATNHKAGSVYGRPVPIDNGISVVLADNAKDYTGPGTNTYVVGDERLWIIDPGPADAAHVAAVETAIAGRSVDGIFVTHTHLDHSPAAKPLKALTGAPVYGSKKLCSKLAALTDEDVDLDFEADHELSGGETIGDGKWRIDVLHTPGHFPNHLCYLLPEVGTLFSGDHVMGWSTTVIVPPLGNLADYLASLTLLEETGATRLLPSHGDAVECAVTRIREVRNHRMMRHAQVGACVARGITEPETIVDMLYDDLTARLIEAARSCVRAHLDMMDEKQPDQELMAQ